MNQPANTANDTPNPAPKKLALETRFEDIASGKFKVIKMENAPLLSRISQCLMPATMTLLCGSPGAGKSFFMIETFWRLHEAGVKVKILMLEDDAAFHQNRILAQMSGESFVLNIDSVARKPELARRILAENKTRLESFSSKLICAQSRQPTLDKIVDWIRKQAEAGVEVIGIDPITAAEMQDKIWAADSNFMFDVKEILERTGARLILATHPRTGLAGKPGLSGLAGGAAYPRFSQTVLWLQLLDKTTISRIVSNNTLEATIQIQHKRVIQICKSRNGRGQGQQIAVSLSDKSLCVEEIGVIDCEATADACYNDEDDHVVLNDIKDTKTENLYLAFA